jgi:hypothetical protein
MRRKRNISYWSNLESDACWAERHCEFHDAITAGTLRQERHRGAAHGRLREVCFGMEMACMKREYHISGTCQVVFCALFSGTFAVIISNSRRIRLRYPIFRSCRASKRSGELLWKSANHRPSNPAKQLLFNGSLLRANDMEHRVVMHPGRGAPCSPFLATPHPLQKITASRSPPSMSLRSGFEIGPYALPVRRSAIHFR